MESVMACAARLVVIAAISSVCEHFLSGERMKKGMDMIVGFMAAGVIADGLTAVLGK